MNGVAPVASENRMVKVPQIKVALKVTNAVAGHKRPIKASLRVAKRSRRLLLKGAKDGELLHLYARVAALVHRRILF